MSQVAEPPPQRQRCLREDDAIALISGTATDPTTQVLLSHVEVCTGCRHLVGAAARARTIAAGPRALSTLTTDDRAGGRYGIVRLLARGGMGEVYQARDALLDETVALKTIVLSALDNQRAIEALKAEVQLARKVSHRNVCRILEFGVHTQDHAGGRETIPFFTMELLQGETLRQRLGRAGTMSVADALPVIVQVIDGLAAIHAASIVHRDLKPENVFLIDEAHGLRAVVMDFGLARPLDLPQSVASFSSTSEQGAGRPAGTLEYMAPEQLRGAPATATFDVYALGTIMFEMLVGTRPFALGHAGSWPATLQRLDRPAPALSSALPGADPVWEEVIGRCLAQDPKQRPQDMGEVRALLDGSARGGSVAARGRGRGRLLASAAVLSAVAAIVLIWQTRRPPVPGAPPPSPSPPAALAAPLGAPASAAAAPSPSVLQPAPGAVAPIATARDGSRSARAARARAAAPVPRPSPPALAEAPAPAAASTGAVAAAVRQPEDVAAMLDRAEGLLVAGSTAAACALGAEAATRAPSLPAAHRFLGRCYTRLPDAATARRHYRRYLELAPDAPDGLFVRAIVGSGK
jgi:tRNA A-37 threonylcarbamoyl transferase component Bud32